MTCKQCKLNISAMLDGCLDQEVCRQVEAHLESCDACREYYEALFAMRGSLAGRNDRPLPEGFEAKLHLALEREAAQPRKWKFTQHMPIMAAAAASVLLIAGAISFSRGIGMKTAKNTEGSAPREQEFSVASDARSAEESAKDYAANSETEAPMEGIMAVPEMAADKLAAKQESLYVHNSYQVGVTTGDSEELILSINSLSLQNSGVINENAGSPEGNSITLDMPAGNYESFIQELSVQYALDYIHTETQDLSDEIYSLQLQEIYLRTAISDLLAAENRTAEEEGELEALREELSVTTARLDELYLLSSSVQVRIIINNAE